MSYIMAILYLLFLYTNVFLAVPQIHSPAKARNTATLHLTTKSVVVVRVKNQGSLATLPTERKKT